MSELISFSFESANVRILKDENGDPLFVGKDLCEVLGYTNPSKAMGDHCKGVTKRYPIVDSLGRTQEVRVLTEPDMLRLIVNSKLPAAQKFEAWVFEEVLPTLRKTGEYKVPRKREPSLITRAGQAASLFHKLKGVAEACGLSGNAAIISANNGVTKLTGVNLLVDMNTTHLVADSRGKTWTPTEIAKRLGLGSPQIVNRLLLSMDYQKKAGDTWLPTEKGQPHGEWYDTGKRHSDGAPVKQWKWFESVVDVIRVVG